MAGLYKWEKPSGAIVEINKDSVAMAKSLGWVPYKKPKDEKKADKK